jgi:Predicted membrane protein
MILLAGLIYLPLPAIFGFGIILVFGHNLLDSIRVPGQGIDAIAWSFLHQPIFLTSPVHLNIIYPIIPWVGVMALGYCLGKIYEPTVDPAKRKKILTWVGSIALLLFVIIRFYK